MCTGVRCAAVHTLSSMNSHWHVGCTGHIALNFVHSTREFTSQIQTSVVAASAGGYKGSGGGKQSSNPMTMKVRLSWQFAYCRSFCRSATYMAFYGRDRGCLHANSALPMLR